MVKTRGTPSRENKVPTGLFSLFWQPQRPPMATKGERGDVPVPWGAWLALVWPWCALVAYGPWSGQSTFFVTSAGYRLFWAVVVPSG